MKSYAWFTSASTDTTAEWTAISGAASSTYKVTSAEVGKFIKVVVTDSNDKTFEAVTTTVVSEDASADVSLVDDYGLQTDGTGIIGDRLRVSYGADFGIPAAITWYKDGAVKWTSTSETNVTGLLSVTIDAADGTGSYYVVVIDKEGKSFQTKPIVITDKEDAAVIKSFTIEDDYTDGSDIVFKETDSKAIATVTLNKNYSGTFSLYKETDTKFSAPLSDTMKTSIVAATQTAAAETDATVSIPANTTRTAPRDGASVLTTNAATNFQVVNAGTSGDGARIGSGYGYINNDGTVTYKFALNSGVTRGTKYVIAFDQDSISSDKPGQGKENYLKESVEAPYVTSPDKIVVTSVSIGNKPEVTFQDANGAALTWLGDGTSVSTLADAGFDSAIVYKATNNTNDPSATGVSKLEEYDKTCELDKGVWTSNTNATNVAYWFAQVKTTKGVYGAASETLTSETTSIANPSASGMALTQDADAATTAVVSFTNLRVAGTVYVVRGSFKTNAQNTITDAHYTSTTEIFEKFDANDSTTYTAKADVTKGAEKVKLESALGAVTGLTSTTRSNVTEASKDYNTDQYVAVFIPEDTVNYGQIYTDDDISTSGDTMAKNGTAATTPTANKMQGLYVEATPTAYSMTAVSKKPTNTAVNTNDTAASGKLSFDVTVKDQFGNAMTIPTATYNAALAKADETATPFTLSTGVASNAGLTITNEQVGAGTADARNRFVLTQNGTANANEGWFIRLGGKYYMVVQCDGTTAGAKDTALWNVSISELSTAPTAESSNAAAELVPITSSLVLGAISSSTPTVTIAETTAAGKLYVVPEGAVGADYATVTVVDPVAVSSGASSATLSASSTVHIDPSKKYVAVLVPDDGSTHTSVISEAVAPEAAKLSSAKSIINTGAETDHTSSETSVTTLTAKASVKASFSNGVLKVGADLTDTSDLVVLNCYDQYGNIMTSGLTCTYLVNANSGNGTELTTEVTTTASAGQYLLFSITDGNDTHKVKITLNT